MNSNDQAQAQHRAAIIGAGAMGTLLAAILGQSMPVVLVCRNDERAHNIFRSGAAVTGRIDAVSRPILVKSLSEVPAAGGASVVFVATKTTAIAGVAHELKNMLGILNEDPAGPLVISFQNGIDPGRELMTRLGHSRVLRMVLSLGATLTHDGSSVQVSMDQPPHAIGSIDPDLEGDGRIIASILSRGGLSTEYVDNIESAVWRKGIINAAVNPVAALVNCTVGEVLDSPSQQIVQRLVNEGVAVAESEGISLAEGYADHVLTLLDRAKSHLPSMVQDIREGRESEIGQLNRQIIEHGQRLGVPTPTHETIDALIETFDWKVYRA